MSDELRIFMHEGYRFRWQEWMEGGLCMRVFAPPGQFHDKYIIYFDTHLDADEADNIPLKTAKLVNAAYSIIHNHERWISECDKRGGLPPPDIARESDGAL